ncbi:MAG: hypothetical protein M5R40_22650 [Anaerolineae bacterium]|nr:hypothetical protein [Anaerolineae bacterium]
MVTSTQHAEPQIDKLLVILRWLLLLGVLAYVILALQYTKDPRVDAHLSTYMPAALAIGTVYNLTLTAIFWVWPARLLPHLSLGTLMLDTLLAALLYWASDGNLLLMVSAGLFPVLIAWLRYGWLGGVLITSVFVLIELVIYPLTPYGQQNPNDLAAIGAIFLGFTGLSVGLIHRRVLEMGGLSGSRPELEAQLLRAARERTRAIYEMAATLNATLEYGKVLDAALDMGALGLREAGSDARLISAVLLFRDDVLYVATARRLTRSDRNVVIDGRRGVIGMALRQAEPVFSDDPHHDPELRYFAAFQDCRSLVCIRCAPASTITASCSSARPT